jgi:hypothetical protein
MTRDASYADSPGDNHFTPLSRLNDANDPLVVRIAEPALADTRRRVGV